MTYIRELAESIRNEVDDGLVPDDADVLFLLYAVLARTKGAQVTAPDVHDAWAAWKEICGADHESAVPFEELAKHVQAEDQPFVDAIHRAIAQSGR